MAHRRRGRVAGVLLAVAACAVAQSQDVHVAEAVKIGEVTSESAVVWVRPSRVDAFDEEAFALEGAATDLRLMYRADDWPDWGMTALQASHGMADYAVEFELEGLTPSTRYEFLVVTDERGGGRVLTDGSFRTAPAAGDAAPVVFTVTTGHRFESNDRPGEGQRIYDSMLALEPSFMAHTGDILYYDRGERVAKNVADARAKWHRLYSLPAHRRFHASVPVYFMKDDHDLLRDDCWPGQRYGDLTFEDGRLIFLEQTPLRDRTYRTVRWGRDLQVWFVEGRDYRTPNREPDGPDKTIWGEEQWGWFERTLAGSDATFKVLVSSTPIVGPDRDSKNDNHSNAGFKTEGDRLRRLIASTPNMYVFCGDRHWQYASRDEATGVLEYSCGPSTDAHSGGWRASDKRPSHRFLRVAGGFLSASVEPGEGEAVLRIRLHDVEGAVVFDESHTVERDG